MRDTMAFTARAGGPAIAARAREEGAAERRGRTATVWAALLLAAICFEGLGRKYVSAVPQPVFYLLKDVILLAGFVVFGAVLNDLDLSNQKYGQYYYYYQYGYYYGDKKEEAAS